jgi:hypothetical protein
MLTTVTMEDTNVEATLDLFDPATLIATLRKQSEGVNADWWEYRHIDAMCKICEYISVTYPAMYRQIEQIHTEFLTKQPDL